MGNGDSIFFSYSHQDKKWLDEIEKVLVPALKGSKIDAWSDKEIKPGMKWKQEIEKALARAKVAVLIVSPDFLASKFIAENELPHILQSAQTRGVTVVWVYVKPAMYRYTDIADFQAAHDVSKPLCTLSANRLPMAILEICEQIIAAHSGLLANRVAPIR
jgi:hypothetical protein